MLTVFGSLNMDIVAAMPALPGAGETVLAEALARLPGGKGANQAVAAARAGARVAMAGAVGADAEGAALKSGLAAEGIDTDAIVTLEDTPSGCALVLVESGGTNQIVVAPGANLAARAAQVPDRLRRPGDTLLLQMETAHAENWRLLAEARGMRRILNLAPAAGLPPATAALLDVLVMNESEAQRAAAGFGLPAGTPGGIAAALARAHDLLCVITLGAAGALACDGTRCWTMPAPVVTAVDTVGAGDAFTGVLAAALDRGAAVPAALRRASVAGALACTRRGAQAAMPGAAEIEKALADAPDPVETALS
jgi:ribokinase